MTTKIPNHQNTQTPSPLLWRGPGGGLQMKPPIFPQELLDRFEQTKAIKFSKKTIKEVNELLNQAEFKKQQNQLPDYTEVAGLKVLTQDLDKPQCPQVKLLKEGQKHQECCCWELEYEGEVYYQYDFHGALKEAEFRGIKVLSDENWTKLEEELGTDGLKELLNLKEQKNYKGYCSGGLCCNRGSNAYYWSSSVYSPSPTNSWRRNLNYSNASVYRNGNTQSNGFSVRCLMD